jgi:DeoR/GlpR family transcriptional regulator of sugar metabolism
MLAIGIINDYNFKLLFFSCQSMSEQSEITWTNCPPAVSKNQIWERFS